MWAIYELEDDPLYDPPRQIVRDYEEGEGGLIFSDGGYLKRISPPFEAETRDDAERIANERWPR